MHRPNPSVALSSPLELDAPAVGGAFDAEDSQEAAITRQGDLALQDRPKGSPSPAKVYASHDDAGERPAVRALQFREPERAGLVFRTASKAVYDGDRTADRFYPDTSRWIVEDLGMSAYRQTSPFTGHDTWKGVLAAVRPLETITDPHVSHVHAGLVAWNVLKQKATEMGLPKYYQGDLEIDRNVLTLGTESPVRFGWLLRECGTHLVDPRADRLVGAPSYAVALTKSFVDSERHFFVYERGSLEELPSDQWLRRLQDWRTDIVSSGEADPDSKRSFSLGKYWSRRLALEDIEKNGKSTFYEA